MILTKILKDIIDCLTGSLGLMWFQLDLLGLSQASGPKDRSVTHWARFGPSYGRLFQAAASALPKLVSIGPQVA